MSQEGAQADDEPLDGAEDIEIKPPREPEVNPDVYKDVVQLLSRGFLTSSADIGSVPFVFKSLNHHEFDMVRLLSGYEEKTSVLPPRFWDLFLSHMVLFIDGHNVLVERRRWLGNIADTFKDFPNAARVRLIRQLSQLNRRASNATTLVEAYATEHYSRWKWAQTKGLDLSTPTLTGIEGTDKIGLNYGQLTWRAVNYYEDLRLQHDSEWDNAKFVGGCFAGKGIQKVYNQDRQRKQKEREEKINRKDQLLRHILLGDPLESDKKYGGAQVVVVASTVEELADQVQRSIRGEKDWHDKVIENYEEGIRNNVQKRQDQIQEIVKNDAPEMHGRSSIGFTDLVGLTSQQVSERIRQQQQQREAAWENADPKLHLDETAAGFMEKWGLMDNGVSTTSRPTDDAIPLQSRRNAGKPWRP